MKKTNILITMFAVMAVASAAKAEMASIDFDGSLKPQTLHDVFTESHQIIPDATLPFPMPSSDTSIPGNFGDCAMYCPPFQVNQDGEVVFPDCCGSTPQFPTWLQPLCANIVAGAGWAKCGIEPSLLESAYRSGKGPGLSRDTIPSRAEVAALAAAYSKQSELKALLVKYQASRPDFPIDIALHIKNAKAKILYDNNLIYIINGQEIVLLRDRNLIKHIKDTGAAQNRVMGLDDFGIGVAIGCVFSESCWVAIGDVVTAVSEEANSHNYNNPHEQHSGYSDQGCIGNNNCE